MLFNFDSQNTIFSLILPIQLSWITSTMLELETLQLKQINIFSSYQRSSTNLLHCFLWQCFKVEEGII